MCCSRTDPRPQVVLFWPSDEPIPVQVRSGVSEFFQATTQFFFCGPRWLQQQGASGQSCAGRLPMMPSRLLVPPVRFFSWTQAPQPHRQGCNVVRHFNLLWVAGECQQCSPRNIPASCACAYFGLGWRESPPCGGSVDPHAACKSRNIRNCFPQFGFLLQPLVHTSSTNCIEPTSVPKTFMPSGFQTSGPNSAISSGHTDARFHTRLI